MRSAHITKTTIRLWSTALIGGLALASTLVAAASAKDVTVHVNGANYGPMPTGLKVGDTITWINDDTTAHTVTARDHSFDLHLNPGRSATLTLQKDGTFQIYCIYHSSMRGVLTAAAK
jgi:plastocyanin